MVQTSVVIVVQSWMLDDIFSGDRRSLLVFKTGYGGDLQVRSHHTLRKAGVKSGFATRPTCRRCHHWTKIAIVLFRRKKGWNNLEGRPSFCKPRYFPGEIPKLKTWALVGQCPGVRHQAIHMIWHSDGFKIGQDNMLSKRTPTRSGSSCLVYKSGPLASLGAPGFQGKLLESPTPCFRRAGKHYSVARRSRVY